MSDEENNIVVLNLPDEVVRAFQEQAKTLGHELSFDEAREAFLMTLTE